MPSLFQEFPELEDIFKNKSNLKSEESDMIYNQYPLIRKEFDNTLTSQKIYFFGFIHNLKKLPSLFNEN